MRQIIFVFILFSFNSFGAARYWVGGGSSTNWNATTPTNWSATSGGSNNATVPGSSDDVTFDGAGSGNGASVMSANITVLSLTFAAGYTNTVTINTATTLTIAGNFTDNTAHSWTVNGTGKITISAASTITSGGKTYPGTITFTGTNTKTLSGNWTISGALVIGGATTLNWTTNEKLICGGLNMTSTCTGTAKIVISGGTWQTGNAIQNNIDIQGDVTVSGSVAYNTGTLTYISGTVTTTSSTLTIAANTTLNTTGITWNNITISGGTVMTLNSQLSASGTFTIGLGLNISFAGSFGFSLSTLTISTINAKTITFNDGITYIITTALNAFTSQTGAVLLFTSDDATNKAILTLSPGATCNVLANFTRIDASGGRPIRTFNGTITSCTNVYAFNDLTTSKH